MLFTTNDRGFLQILPSTHPMKSVSNQPVEIATGNGDCCCPFCFPEAMPCSSGGKAAAPAADEMVRAVGVGSAEQQQQESPEGVETTGGDLEYPKSGQLAGYHLCLNRFVEVSCLPVFKSSTFTKTCMVSKDWEYLPPRWVTKEEPWVKAREW